MRLKSTASRVARSVPPPELRMFTDPSRPEHRGADLGVNVYADRDAWLAARREWERANGISLQDWFTELLAETHEAGCTLAELNMAFSEYLVEDDDWSDASPLGFRTRRHSQQYAVIQGINSANEARNRKPLAGKARSGPTAIAAARSWVLLSAASPEAARGSCPCRRPHHRRFAG